MPNFVHNLRLDEMEDLIYRALKSKAMEQVPLASSATDRPPLKIDPLPEGMRWLKSGMQLLDHNRNVYAEIFRRHDGQWTGLAQGREIGLYASSAEAARIAQQMVDE